MRTLSARLVAIELAFLIVALLSIGLTLYLSWSLEGSAAAINDAGSLRMRAYRLALVAQDGDRDAVVRESFRFDAVLAELRTGDPVRPLAVPGSRSVQSQLQALSDHWAALRPHIGQEGATFTIEQADQLVHTVDDFVHRIETANATSTELLRGAQLGLLALAITGTVALIYLSFMFVIRPLMRVREGIERMAEGDMAVRLAVESQDEFGALTRGFNDMASRLQDSYRTLEQRVDEKTRDLARQNQRLATLYDMAAFFGTAQATDELCRGFVTRIVRAYDAAGGAVRLRGMHEHNIHIAACEGVSREFLEQERCLRDDLCGCGEAIQQTRPVVLMIRAAAALPLSNCRKEGFETVLAIPIEFRHTAIGVFNLFFRQPRTLGEDEHHLLETLGQHLGVAIENLRLIEREREMAVFEERNLLAQELHDSIAQSLAFLNLQTQMLGDAMKHQDAQRAAKSLSEINAGVQECYADVRELLTHFRTRVGSESLEGALHSILVRFERQTGIPTRLDIQGSAQALAPDRELQMIHIAQEALSNIRKHAACSHVDVTLERGPVYCLRVCDNGQGFDPTLAARLEDHVGLRIMRERAERAGGELAIRSTPGQGTDVVLTLPLVERQVA